MGLSFFSFWKVGRCKWNIYIVETHICVSCVRKEKGEIARRRDEGMQRGMQIKRGSKCVKVVRGHVETGHALSLQMGLFSW